MSIIEILKTQNLAKIISYTSPGDACRLGLVSSVFRAAADSDLVWGRFLSPDYQEFICKSLLLTPSSLKLVLKKDIYFYLCDHPIVFDNDKTVSSYPNFILINSFSIRTSFIRFMNVIITFVNRVYQLIRKLERNVVWLGLEGCRF